MMVPAQQRPMQRMKSWRAACPHTHCHRHQCRPVSQNATLQYGCCYQSTEEQHARDITWTLGPSNMTQGVTPSSQLRDRSAAPALLRRSGVAPQPSGQPGPPGAQQKDGCPTAVLLAPRCSPRWAARRRARSPLRAARSCEARDTARIDGMNRAQTEINQVRFCTIPCIRMFRPELQRQIDSVYRHYHHPAQAACTGMWQEVNDNTCTCI